MHEELEKYRALLGPSSSPELASLTRLLEEKEEELEKLRLLEIQRGEVSFMVSVSLGLSGMLIGSCSHKAEKSLYAELDKLSSAWEALDRQVKNKVFELAAIEDRLSKSAMDVSSQDFPAESVVS